MNLLNLEQRKMWNVKHKTLTGMLARPDQHLEAVALFLEQHRWLYASGAESSGQRTYEDEILSGLTEQAFRTYPVHTTASRNSIAWHLWHAARIEDITMNILVAGREQVLHSGGFAEKLNTRASHSGNGMNEAEIAELSADLSFEALKDYRLTVAARTRSLISGLSAAELKAKVDASRLRQVSEQEAVKASEQWLLDYWGGKTAAGLVLMPATRHNFLHLNKAMKAKLKLQKQPVSP
ncbi:DinB family protein [Paenibacillus typhae]|uniref:DinB superfamily protein n=1 Tax=Paenibacillus typhae TaxID=1174501 RepID=A0A1G8SX89_9BACL|nr:DinB family protein [Paenibacillus typhae]SDJ33847.1 DinB superfamily protein [Paenibacillus typhae]